jgi:hypothetical protein
MTRRRLTASPLPRWVPALLPGLLAMAAALPSRAQETVVISEFMAINNASKKAGNLPMVDEEKSYEDWVELHNAGATAVNLGGWSLTDDPLNLRKWTIPPVEVGAGQHLVIWCSAKDRSNPALPLHTSFKLAGGGDYLALVRRDGSTIAHEYAPAYPPQTGDVSYGLNGAITEDRLVGPGTVVRFLAPADATAEAAWFQGGYTPDASWGSVTLQTKDTAVPPAAPRLQTVGLGYSTTASSTLNRHLADGGNVRAVLHDAGRTSLWMRSTFTVANPAAHSNLRLRLKYDDGFVAYLNGVPVAAANAPETRPLAWNETATAATTDSLAVAFKEFPLGASAQLAAGENVLAIHGLNVPLGASSDALWVPELVVDTATPPGTQPVYFTVPTPGLPNGPGAATIPPLVLDLTENPPPPAPGPFTLAVTARIVPTKNPVAGATLYWRRQFDAEASAPMRDDGQGGDAVAGDGVFTGLITGVTLGAGEMVRWRVAAQDTAGLTGRAPANNVPNDSQVYHGTVAENPALATSRLPVLHWFMAPGVNPDSSTRVRVSLSYAGEFYDNAGADVHGQSTSGFTKKSYNIDFPSDHAFRYDPARSRVADIKLLTNYADKTKVHTTVAYQMLRDAGVAAHFAFPVRVQRNGQFFAVAEFVEDADELYLERAGLNPEGALYKMYNFVVPNLSPGGSGYEKKTRRTETAADLNAMATGLAQTGEALLRYGFDNVNLPATVNHLAAYTMTSATDVAHKNYYVYRNTTGTGEWQLLPWDLDLSFGRVWTGDFNYFNDRVYATNAVSPTGAAGNGNKFWDFGFRGSPAIQQMYMRRLRTLRDQFLSPPGGPDDWHVINFSRWLPIIDATGDATSDAALDLAKWRPAQWKLSGAPNNVSPFAGFTMAQEINRRLTEYVPQRRTFLYTTYGPSLPAAQPPAPPMTLGAVEFNPGLPDSQHQEYFTVVNPNNYAVEISGWTITGGVEFTFPPGTVIPSATLATTADPDRNKLYVARNAVGFRGRTTSPKAGEKRFVVSGYNGQLSARGESLELRTAAGTLITSTSWTPAPTPAQQWLRVSEIHFAPAEPTPAETTALPGVVASDFEFLELVNTGAAELDLSGARFTEGIEFTLPPATTLAPGARLVVAANTAALALRHPAAGVVVGNWWGRLNNDGERLQLLDGAGETVLDFTYNDAWYPWAEDHGHSLVMLDEVGTPYADWDQRSRWGVSQQTGGSPGAAATTGLVFAFWQNQFSAAEREDPLLSGPDANPDQDDLANLAEYGLGQDPRSGQRRHDWLQASVRVVEGRPHLAVEYRRAQNLLDLDITTESSADGRTWEPAVMTMDQPAVDHGDGTETVRLRQTTPIAAEAGIGMVRLRFTQRP